MHLFFQIELNRLASLYDPSNLDNSVINYCIVHADRVAAGENVIQDLVTARLVAPYAYVNKTCSDVQADKSWQDMIHSMVR